MHLQKYPRIKKINLKIIGNLAPLYYEVGFVTNTDQIDMFFFASH